MKKIEIVSKITLSIALISALGLAGCGSSSEAINSNANNSNSLAVSGKTTIVRPDYSKEEEKKTTTPSEKKKSYNVVFGKVSLDETPVDNVKVRSLSKTKAEIIAYNLSDSSTYKTITDTNGNYELSGLSDGDYQIFAQNDRYAKKASQRVTLSKSTRQAVNFSLQASGSVSGKIVGASVVYIPGTDHVSIPDSEGKFSLNGVPVGSYILMYEADGFDQRASVEINVLAGEVASVNKESGFSHDEMNNDPFGRIDTSLEYGVLGLHYDGIKFDIYGLPYDDYKKYEDYSYEKERGYSSSYDLNKYISLTNSRGDSIDFDIEDGAIKTRDIVPAGEYTLTFSKDISQIVEREINSDRIYKFKVDEISVAYANMDHGVRVIDIMFPKLLTDTQKSSLDNLKVVEKGTTESLSLTSIWSDDRVLSLFGSFKTGVEYIIVPIDEAQKAIIGNMKILDGVLEFGNVDVENIYPKDGADNIDVTQNLFVTVGYSDKIDPSTVEFKLGDKVYKGKDIVFDQVHDSYRSSSMANISFKHESLEYEKDYTLTFKAQDISGNDISKTTTFKTMKPSIVKMSPESMDELFDDRQNITFNVPVDRDSGSITIENLIDSSSVANVKIDRDISKFDNYDIYFSLSSLSPNQRYKITASGFKDLDGIDIPSKSREFTTPPKMLLIPEEYSQNMNVSLHDFNHKVELFFFGGLSDAEKEFLENNLVVTSNNSAIAVDSKHPQRKLFFTPVDNGLIVSVAFTIEPDTNYELSLSSISGLSNIVLPDDKKLVSFATTRLGDYSNMDNSLRMINRLSIHQPHLEMGDPTSGDSKLVGDIDISVNIPLGYAPRHEEEEGYSYYEDCWSIYNNTNEIGRDMLENSLHVTSGGVDIPVEMGNINSSWMSSYYINSEKICYLNLNSSVAFFDAEYDKDYQVSLDFSDKINSELPVSNKVLTKNLHVDPIGTLNFEILDGNDNYMPEDYKGRIMMDPNMIMLNIHANAPMLTSNIKDLLNIKVNGETFTPEFNFDRDNLDRTQDISFALPRTLYSVLQVEISRNPDQNMTFINPFTNEEIVNNSAFDKPIIFTEDVKPDLLPVEVNELKTTSIDNNKIAVNFNRPIDINDIVTKSEDGTISDIAFEVKSSDGQKVEISGVDVEFDRVIFNLSSDLNVSKRYTLSLKSGKSIKAAFGAQKLTQFSQDIELTYLEVVDAKYIHQNATIRNSADSAYQLGSTNRVDANYNNSTDKVVVPLMIKDGVVVNEDKSNIRVTNRWNMNEILNEGNLIYNEDSSVLVQPIRNYYNINVNSKIVYSVNNQESIVEFDRENLTSLNIAYIKSYQGDSVDSIIFSVMNMQQGYQITSENFKVYDENGEIFDANVNVQFNDQSNTSAPRVTFNNLVSGKTYRVDIVDIASSDMPTGMKVLNDTLFISMP